MSDRLKKLRVVDPVLTQLARGYRNAKYVGESLFPVAELDKESGIIPLFGKEAFRLWETERAIRAKSNVSFNLSSCQARRSVPFVLSFIQGSRGVSSIVSL